METDRQTDRRTDRQTDRQTDSWHTCQYSLPHALSGHVSRLPPILRKWCLKNKMAEFVHPLKLRYSLFQRLFSKIWLHMGDLNVGLVQVQGLHIHLG